MKHGDRLRERVRALIGLGVTQKVIASKLGLSESTLSRWLRLQPDSKGNPVKIAVETLDAFDAYLDEFVRFAQETQRSAAPAENIPTTLPGAAGPPFHEHKPQRKSGRR